MEPDPQPAQEPSIYELFANFVERLNGDSSQAIEALLEKHPHRAAEVERFRDDLEAARELLGQLQSVAHGSEGHQVSVASAPDVSQFLARLRAKEPPIPTFEVLDEIGRGAMGVVMRVWDEALRRPLAMKILRCKSAAPATPPSEGNSQSVARFLEEAQVMGQLDHPSIVPVHHLGVDAQGEVYFTMKLVKGKTLSEVFTSAWNGDEGWNTARALGVLLKICEAMTYAHTKGVLHRDLKPSNVMVGRFGEAYVMDWGLARIVGHADNKDIRLRPANADTVDIRSYRRDTQAQGSDSPLLTMDGDVVGTPAYMSPEQALGHVDDLGPATDVYSVGAMLYHLLAGRAPYSVPGVRTSSYAVLMRLRAGPPEPLVRIARRLPRDLTKICEKAMARDPKERYATMAELAEDLRAHLEGRVLRAHSRRPIEKARKWIARNRPLAASLAAAAMLAASGAWGVRHVAAKGASDQQRLTYFGLMQAAADALADGRCGAARQALDDAPLSLRRWEWDHLHAQLDTARRVVSVGSPASRLACNPVADFLAVGGSDGAVRLFGLADGALRRVLEGHAAPITRLALSADAKQLFSGDTAGVVRGWDTATGVELFAPLTEQRFGVADLLVADNVLASSAGDHSIWWRNATTGQEILHLGPERRISDRARLAFRPDGKMFATWGGDQSVEIWPPLRSKADGLRLVMQFMAGSQPIGVQRLPGADFPINELEFSPDSRLLAAVGDGGPVLLWTVAHLDRGVPPEELRPLTLAGGHAGHSALAFSPDSRLLATGWIASIAVYDFAAQRLIARLHGHDEPLVDLAFAEDGRTLVSADRSGEVRVWDVDDLVRRRSLPRMTSQIVAVDIAPSERSAAFFARWGELLVVDLDTFEARRIETKQEYATGVGFLRQGQFLVTVDSRSELALWRVSDGRMLQRLSGERDARKVMATLDEKGLTAFPDAAGRVEIYALEGSGEAARLHLDKTLPPAGEVTGLTFGPAPGVLAAVTREGSVVVYAMETNEIVLQRDLESGALVDIDAAPSGALFAVCGAERRIHLLSADDLATESFWTWQARDVRAVRFLGDDRVVAVSDDGLATLWSTRDGERVVTFAGDTFGIRDLAIAGDTLAFGGLGQTPIVWRGR